MTWQKNFFQSPVFFNTLLFHVIKGIQYSDSISLGVYCTQGSDWMHSALGFDASNLIPSGNKHLTILNLYKVFPSNTVLCLQFNVMSIIIVNSESYEFRPYR